MDGSAGDAGAAAAGFGGQAGANADPDAANVIAQQMASACVDLSSTQCSVDICLAGLLQDHSNAELYGCLQEFMQFLNCNQGHPYQCDASPGPNVNPVCASEHDKLVACLPTCSGVSTETQTTLTCTGKIPWSASCNANGQQCDCTCVTGPHAGAAVTLDTSCSGLDAAQLLQDFCVGVVSD